MEPILLEDFSSEEKPKTFTNLLHVLEQDNSTSSTDLLVGLTYVLFLESGFVPIEKKEECEDGWAFDYQRLQRLSKYLPKNWKTASVYSFVLILPPFWDQKTKVTCFLLGDDLIINCITKEVENGEYTVCLDPLLYFSGSAHNLSSKHLQNLNHLSRVVKNDICYRAKQDILHQNNVITECFEALPPEILSFIARKFTIKDLIRFGIVNKYFNKIMKTPNLWLYRLRQDFKGGEILEETNRLQALQSYEVIRDFYKAMFLTNHPANPLPARYRDRRFFNPFGGIF